MKDEFKSLTLAVLLSFIAIYSVNYFFGINKYSSIDKSAIEFNKVVDEFEKSSNQEISENSTEEQDTIANESKRLKFNNNAVSGSIRLNGARFDELYLDKYNVSLEDNSPKVELLKSANNVNHYFAEYGWLALDKNVKLPNATSEWISDDVDFSDTKEANLVWSNNNGVIISRKISMDKNYLFTITDTVTNNTSEELEIFPYARISRNIENMPLTRSVVHEGMSAIIDNTLEEFKYTDIKANKSESFESKGGWFGFSDRYWFSAFVLDDNEKNKITFKNIDDKNYQIDYVGSRLLIPAHKSNSYTYRFFAGAKEIKLLDKYTKTNQIKKFDLAVDFGWYYFLTKPFFYILDFLYGFLGNMGWAILLFAALLRLAMFPIANKS